PAETPVMQAAELLRSGKAAAAVPILEKLSRDHPDDGTVYPWLAEGYLSTERPAEGRTALDTALRLNLPAKILMPVVLKYANYYTAKGHFEEAEKLFQSATSVVTAKEAADSRARLYMSWAEDDLRKSNLQAAVNHLNIAMSVVDDVDEPMKSMVPHRLSECLRQLAAVAEVSEKNDRKAIELLEKALTVSDEPLTRMNLALIYARSGKNDLAIENYQRVSSADPNNLEARHHLIDLLCQKGDYKGAQLALVDLTERERSMENFQLLAGINLKLKNYAGAVRALEDACDIGPKPELLKQLESTLLEWAALLTKQNKPQEAASVKGHADRIAEQLALIAKTEDKTSKQLEDEDSLSQKPDDYFEKVPPIALSSSRIWLAKGSLTPEGEIRIKNISGRPVKDLTLAAVFYDNSTRRANGSVTLPVASPNSPPFETGGSRTLYFSCPNIVKTDHRLAVVIMWKGRFLKEFPVVKQL
ncbi:MAG TPA: tetratricopeptide repeat protein, partial [Candidatus Obscuribacterales bacterium]